MKKIFMASLALITFAAALTLFQLSSCKKAGATPTTTYPAAGLWIGTYSVDGQPSLAPQYYSFVLKPDSSMICDSKGAGVQHLSTGTWSLKGTVLTAAFTCVYGIPANIGASQTITATFDNSGKLTGGTWKFVAPLTGSGTFTMARVN